VYLSTLEGINEIINNPYKKDKEELRQKIVNIQNEIADKSINERNLLEDKLDTLLTILGQY
jgi:formate-dependent nitrite reductase cytochrome c552 subunit